MAMTAGTATVSADSAGNVTIGGTGMAYALAVQMKPSSMTPALILQLKNSINNPTQFQTILNAMYVDQANALAAAIVPYIQTNAVVSGSSVT